MLPAELRELLRITEPGGIRERPLDFICAGEGGR